ncbi:hypothetical protein [Encephalitozoon cuniculi GB-M1]|uniref:Uncharacterized protein n=2 Tax=Encephalitozoon cuniculi TaxID=6035 RepID=Q8SUL1_ENCCU|nr:uncharacterized protein ECU08_1600 [Encephalitozoon cuniculi GB-M1]KMV65687.1 hypothetical protein M970_081620 [Encephalitozoon cuniculi EcunIII-L]CAD26464.2 hypothetical protein [Encephalitozoon cuniculi GB-M1]
MGNGDSSTSPDVDQRRFHNILQRFLTQFKLKKPMITNYMVYHLDYLVANFCYFKDIALVSECLCTENNRFNFAFYQRMNVFIRIIDFGNDTPAGDECNAWGSVGGLAIGDARYRPPPCPTGYAYPMTKEEWIRKSKDALFGPAFEFSNVSDMEDEDSKAEMKEALRNFEVSEYFGSGEDEEYLVFNSRSKVLKHFFEVLGFHFRIHPHYMTEALDHRFICSFLDLLDFEPALNLFGILLGLKGLNMQKLAMLLKDAHPISVLIERKHYVALKMLLLVDWMDNESGSMSSDEEGFFHDEMMSAGEKLISVFLREESYFEYKQVYDIIEILNCSHRCPKLEIPDFKRIDSKLVLYIKLMVGQLDLLMDEIFQKKVHVTLIDLFFGNPDYSALLIPLTIFLSSAIRNQSRFSMLIDIGFLDRFHDACIRSIAVDNGPRPAVESIFSCLVYIYPLVAFYLAKVNRELLNTDKWVYLSSMMDPYHRKEKLSYSNDEAIEMFLDGCASESFARYMCHLVVDEMPVPSLFLEKK